MQDSVNNTQPAFPPQDSTNAVFPAEDSKTPTQSSRSFGIISFLRSRYLIIASVLVVIAAVGGIYAYNNIYFAPEKVLAKSLAKMQEATSFGVDAGITAINTENGDDHANLFLSDSIAARIQGRVDYKDKNNPKSEFDLDIKSGLISFLTGKIRVLDQKSYFYLDNTDGLESLLMGEGKGYLSFLTGNWIKIDKGEIQSYGYDGSAIENTAFDMGEVVRLLGENNPLKITSQLPTEQIDGQDMFHYGFELDKDKLKSFLEEFQKSYYNDNLDPNLQDNIQNSIDRIGLTGGQIWIGKNDYYLYKVSFGIAMAGASGGEPTLDIDLAIKDINAEVDINVPESAKTVKDILQNLEIPPESLSDY